VLAELSLDLQIHICGFLHPFQIIALRQTCKAFRDITSKKIIWIHALNRICRKNLLFRPTFPVHDMSVAELERAAAAPLRWIALSSSKDRDKDRCLPSRMTRVLKNPVQSMIDRLKMPRRERVFRSWRPYLVPGGRYLVINGLDCLGVWDLGYVSDSGMSPNEKPPKMWATRVNHIRRFPVHPTPDGLGIRILTHCSESPDHDDALYVFEIYPQSKNPELAKIGQLILHQVSQYLTFFLHGNKVIIHVPFKKTVIVWDFIANAVAGWSIESHHNNPIDKIIRVTETNIIMCCYPSDRPTLWIFHIPPLIPKTPSFDSEELYFPELSPVLTFAYPELTSLSQTPDEWYYGDLNSPPLYFDMSESSHSSAYTRCKLDITSDLRNISFAPIVNKPSWRCLPRLYLLEYRICEGRPVNVCCIDYPSKLEAYTGCGATLGFGLSSDFHDSSLTRSSIRVPLAMFSRFYSFCPASGRLVHAIGQGLDGNLFIRDFL